MLRFISLAALFALPTLAPAQALTVKEMPDDVRATIAKEMSRKHLANSIQKPGASAPSSSANDDEPVTRRRAGSAPNSGGCNMDVGSQDQPSRAPRRTVTVVSGPIVQICK